LDVGSIELHSFVAAVTENLLLLRILFLGAIHTDDMLTVCDDRRSISLIDVKLALGALE
jgi:hypothetical protein